MKEILAVIIIWINAISGLAKQTLIDPMRGYGQKITNYELSPKGTRYTARITNGEATETGEKKTSEQRESINVIPTKKIIRVMPTGIADTAPWGIAQQIDKVTWTMKVGMDAKMATPNEILEALNNYRVRRGSQKLTWDTKLADYAQSRAKYLNGIKKTDSHEGFKNFVEKEDGYNKLGYDWLGENISYGFQLEGVHLIEWMYAGDKPHDDNQVDTKWDHVGIGVNGTATCLIFATSKR